MSLNNPDAEDAYPVADDQCLDADGEVWPEHDYPPQGEGGTCRRCGAEADPDPLDCYDDHGEIYAEHDWDGGTRCRRCGLGKQYFEQHSN